MQKLHTLMALPEVAEITVTSDGFFLARQMGDIGFNLFLGQPNPGEIGREYSAGIWAGFTFAERKAVVRAAHRIGVNLRIFLPKRIN